MDQVNINESISISNLISRIETNKNFYGRFEIGPFAQGQAITVANMLRRTLLSELSGLAITAVEIQEVSHEYMTLPGMSESVQDIILNLKQLIFRSDFDLKQSEFGFLCIQGPAVVKAYHFRLPSFIKCVDPEQYIATLAFNGQLNLKIQICQGKNYKFQTPLDLNWPGSGVLSSTQSDKSKIRLRLGGEAPSQEVNNLLIRNCSVIKNSLQFVDNKLHEGLGGSEATPSNNLLITNGSEGVRGQAPSPPNPYIFEKPHTTGYLSKNDTTAITNSNASPLTSFNQSFSKQDHRFNVQSEYIKQKSEYFSKLVKSSSTNIKAFQVSDFTTAKTKVTKPKIIYKSSTNTVLSSLDNKLQSFNLEYSSKQKTPSIKEIENRLLKVDHILPVDAIFTPVTKVNYLICLDEKVKPFKETVLLEVWTNGSITPKTAVYKAADHLLELILPLSISKSVFH